jgi:Family of unknown function (DUF5947)
MNAFSGNSGRGALATLQQFVRKPREQTEFCELCSAPLASHHQHLLEIDKRSVTCACDACAILFGGTARQRYRRIPRDIYRLQDFVLDDHEWDSLLIPINLAFFFYDSRSGKTVANYPSPGGAMESLLDLEYWNAVVERNPVLNTLQPDVEALLVNRISSLPQYYRVPIDQCFRLVGCIRMHWHGLSGGAEVWNEIDRYFHELNQAVGGQLA